MKTKMETSVFTIKEFNKLLSDLRINSGDLQSRIHYFHYSDTNSWNCSQEHLDHLRFIVAYDKKNIMDICKFAYWEVSKSYSVSYLSTHTSFTKSGVAKSILKELFKYFKENYQNKVLSFSGYSIDGWLYLRKYILEYSQEFNVEIQEKPIEYITEWTDENRNLYNESRKIVKPLY